MRVASCCQFFNLIFNICLCTVVWVFMIMWYVIMHFWSYSKLHIIL